MTLNIRFLSRRKPYNLLVQNKIYRFQMNVLDTVMSKSKTDRLDKRLIYYCCCWLIKLIATNGTFVFSLVHSCYINFANYYLYFAFSSITDGYTFDTTKSIDFFCKASIFHWLNFLGHVYWPRLTTDNLNIFLSTFECIVLRGKETSELEWEPYKLSNNQLSSLNYRRQPAAPSHLEFTFVLETERSNPLLYYIHSLMQRLTSGFRVVVSMHTQRRPRQNCTLGDTVVWYVWYTILNF